MRSLPIPSRRGKSTPKPAGRKGSSSCTSTRSQKRPVAGACARTKRRSTTTTRTWQDYCTEEVGDRKQFGNVTRVEEYADAGDDDPNRATLYAYCPNTEAWIVDKVALTNVYAGAVVDSSRRPGHDQSPVFDGVRLWRWRVVPGPRSRTGRGSFAACAATSTGTGWTPATSTTTGATSPRKRCTTATTPTITPGRQATPRSRRWTTTTTTTPSR